MDKTILSHRKKLNGGQLDVLYLLYKFRFGSNDLIAQYFGKKDRSFVYKRLSILLERGLIGKRFDTSYRLQGKPAAYYLTPDGARELMAARGTDVNIKSIYKDRSVFEQFVRYSLEIFAIHNKLKEQYGGDLKFFTKANLNYEEYDYFPKPLPDAYFRIVTDDTAESKQYFLEVSESTKPFFVSVRKMRRYIAYDESGEWDGTGTSLPTIILACDNETLKKRIDKQLTKLNNQINSDEIKYILISNMRDFYATTSTRW